jgi:chaperonin GroES
VVNVIRPLGDRVLVVPDEIERKVGNVILPDNIQEKPRAGVVLAVGAGNVNTDGTRTRPDVQDGDHVLFSQHVGVWVKIGRKDYLMLREPDILGVVDDVAVEEAEREQEMATT